MSNKPLPIATYKVTALGPLESFSLKIDPKGPLCRTMDVRELVEEHQENIHAARVSLAQEISGVLQAYGYWTPDIHKQPSDVISAVGEALKKAKERRDKLREDWAEVLAAKLEAEQQQQKAEQRAQESEQKLTRLVTAVTRVIHDGRFDQLEEILNSIKRG